MTTGDIKVPRKQVSTWLKRALESAPKDGSWVKVRDMAPSSAEQTARALNSLSNGPGWVFGYRISFDQTGPLSELWVKWG